jgi:hypothetical protein
VAREVESNEDQSFGYVTNSVHWSLKSDPRDWIRIHCRSCDRLNIELETFDLIHMMKKTWSLLKEVSCHHRSYRHSSLFESERVNIVAVVIAVDMKAKMQ